MKNRLAPNLTITDDVKEIDGRHSYSVRLDCPTCEQTGRHDGTTCGRCAGHGFVWAKPAKPTEAEKAEAVAKLEAEAKIAAGHRAAGLALRKTAAERRAIMAAEAAAHEAATGEQAARDAADAKQAESDADLWATIAAENDAAVEKQVADFAATLDALTAPKPENDARVFPLRMAEASGRADLVVMLCDSCFSVKARVADCFRCEGHGMVWLTPAALEAKAASVAERRSAPVTDPADLEDDDPTADRARVWDEAADAYRRVFLLDAVLVNPYYAAPEASEDEDAE